MPDKSRHLGKSIKYTICINFHGLEKNGINIFFFDILLFSFRGKITEMTIDVSIDFLLLILRESFKWAGKLPVLCLIVTSFF